MEKPTLKEYKAMIEGSTPAPWYQSHRQIDGGGYSTQIYTEDGETIASLHWYFKDMGNGVTGTYREGNAEFIAASRNIAPELIRVIELSEDALLSVIRVADRQTIEFDRVHQVLSEIRKLRGNDGKIQKV